jgi:hypothetical protein
VFLKEKKEEEKKEESKEEKKEEEKKEEKKEEEPAPEIVLKVDMHCEACARKVARALKGFEGQYSPFSTHYVLSSLFEFSHYFYFYFSLKI